MNCQSILERIDTVASHPLSAAERQSWAGHLTACDECSDALRGAEALQVVRQQPVLAAPVGLYQRMLDRTVQASQPAKPGGQFWLGAGFGGAVAAAIVAVVVTLGFLGEQTPSQSVAAEFMISMQESRELNIAIDSEHALPGARISIILPEGVQLAGYGGQRELTWTDDLAAGVNKLTLPLIALAQSGGQMIVKLDHENSHQVFFINLKPDA
jgi:hypothetical protein